MSEEKKTVTIRRIDEEKGDVVQQYTLKEARKQVEQALTSEPRYLVIDETLSEEERIVQNALGVTEFMKLRIYRPIGGG